MIATRWTPPPGTEWIFITGYAIAIACLSFTILLIFADLIIDRRRSRRRK